MRTIPLFIAAASALVLSACDSLPRSQAPEPTYEQAQNLSFSTANYNAVTELMKRYQGPVSASNTGKRDGANAPFIVSTLVNIDQLEQSSTLGRLISEQIASRMTQMGFGVVELKVRNSVYMKRNEGEFMLTREISDIASTHKAQAVVLGTYAESASMVYVNLKLVNPTNSQILAAYDYALPLDSMVRSLLRKGYRTQ